MAKGDIFEFIKIVERMQQNLNEHPNATNLCILPEELKHLKVAVHLIKWVLQQGIEAAYDK